MSTDNEDLDLTDMRAWAANLFGDKPETETPPDPAAGNHAPNEGNTPAPPDPNREMRQFAANVFNMPDRDNLPNASTEN